MTKNVGAVDRWTRIVAGVVLLILGFFAAGPGWGRWVLVILGLIGLGTGAASY